MESLLRQFTQAASIAEQGDETLREWVGAAVSSKPFVSAEPPVEELTRRFDARARRLSGALTTSSVEDDDNCMAAAALEEVLEEWEEQLSHSSPATGGRLVPLELLAFLRSRALETVLDALVQSPWRYPVLRHSATFAAEEMDDERIADTAAIPEEAAGVILARLLGRASAVPASASASLLGLLVDAMEASERCRCDHLCVQSDAVAKDLDNVLRAITLGVQDSSEAEMLAASRLCGEAERALDIVGADAAKRLEILTPRSTSIKNLPVKSEVWACWAGDGRWYRASVKSVGRHVQIEWLKPPFVDEYGGSCDEYLCANGLDNSTFTELSRAAVLLVEDTMRRPVPSLGTEIPDMPWVSWLSAAEAQARRLHELRSLCADLESHRKSGGIGTNQPKKEQQQPPATRATDAALALRVELNEEVRVLGQVVSDSAEEAQRVAEQVACSTSAFQAELGAVQEKRAHMAAQVVNIRKSREELLEQQRRLSMQLEAVEQELSATMVAEADLSERERTLHASRARVSEELSEQLHTAQDSGHFAAQRQGLLASVATTIQGMEDQFKATAQSVADAVSACEKLQGKEQALCAACVTTDGARYAELQDLLGGWHEILWGPDAIATSRNPAQAVALHDGHVRALAVVDAALAMAEQDAAAAAEGKSGSAKVLENFFGLGELVHGDGAEFVEQMGRIVPQYTVLKQQLCKNLDRLKELEQHAFLVSAKQLGAGGG